MIRIFRKRSILDSQKLVRRGRFLQGLKSLFLVTLFVGLIWSLSYISHVPQLTVQNIIVSGNSAVPSDGVLAVAHSALYGNNVWIFPRANTFWYPKKEILNTLQYSYAWIDKVEIDKINLTTIEIKIKERVPVAVYCGRSREEVALSRVQNWLISEKNSRCSLVDSQGYLFAKAPDFVGDAYVKLYGTLTSANWRGAQYYNQVGVGHILALIKGLGDIGFDVVTAQTISDDEYHVFSDTGAAIYLKISYPVDDILSNISSLLAQKIFVQSKKLHNFSDLMYIDERFGNKIFYKFK